jgi:hypothetical protein
MARGFAISSATAINTKRPPRMTPCSLPVVHAYKAPKPADAMTSDEAAVFARREVKFVHEAAAAKRLMGLAPILESLQLTFVVLCLSMGFSPS